MPAISSNRRIVRRLVATIAAISTTLLVWSCTQSSKSVLVVEDRVHTISPSDLADTNVNPSYRVTGRAVTLGELAALAANVYMPDDAFDEACNPDIQTRIRVSGWERLRGWSEPPACNSALNDLKYEVWGAYKNGYMHIAIVFQGTVAPKLAHWCANLRAVSSIFCDPKSDQYLAIPSLMDNIVSGIYDEWGGDVVIFVVGHSLGGGVAELAGNSSYIENIVTFNSSPVTARALSNLARAANTAVAGQDEALAKLNDISKCGYTADNPINGGKKRVHSIVENFDALHMLRLINRWLDARDSNKVAVEYRTNFSLGTPIEEHSMKRMACAMKAHARSALSFLTTGDRVRNR